jgi:hypothetical protein
MKMKMQKALLNALMVVANHHAVPLSGRLDSAVRGASI